MPNGYGQINVNGRAAYAHRVSYELHKGPIGASFVLHSCDNRKCVNPAHLSLGSFDDNMADMVSKSRQAHSERNPHAKLTSDQVRAIRQEVGSNRLVASRYNVSPGTISMIRSGRIWRQV